LQSLGTKATSDYVRNVANVVHAESGLVKVRKEVFDHLQGTDFHAVVLANMSSQTCNVDSRFFHFGTTDEYLELLTEDKALQEIISVNLVSECAGLPLKYVSENCKNADYLDSAIPENVVGLMGSAAPDVSVLPCIMHSVTYAGVRLVERSIIEYSTLRECVTIGRNCIVSHCSVGQKASIPANTFAHTIPIHAEKVNCSYNLGYCTVLFGINDNLKSSAEASQLQYMGKSMSDIFSDCERLTREKNSLKLWEAKLFRIFQSPEESFADAIEFLRKFDSGGSPQNTLGEFPRLSMADILRIKNVDEMLRYRQEMQTAIDQMKADQSFLPELQTFANSTCTLNKL